MGEHGHLDRFVEAQDGIYLTALGELREGRKRSHWMWFIFPQISGLGQSPTARHFAIDGRDEAASYISHKLLGGRLVESTEAMLDWVGRKSAEAILGSIDSVKFRSSMTLFEAVAPDEECFAEALDGFYGGDRDDLTLERL